MAKAIKCQNCDGGGDDMGKTCEHCNGTGREPSRKKGVHTYAFIVVHGNSHVSFKTDGGFTGSNPIAGHRAGVIGSTVAALAEFGVREFEFRIEEGAK